MNEDFWKDKYPAGIAADINPDEYPNIQAVLKQSCQRFANKPAFSNLGKTITYGELYELSGAFAAYLQQHTDLQPGDRIAVQLPNLLQYPVAVFGAIRAGLIVVNTNPLYTAREMEHQFNDSGAKALVCLANMAHRQRKNMAPGVFTFPLEFAAIKPALRAFIATLFEENPFQFQPVFRGFYFTSALQEGEPVSASSQQVARRFDLAFAPAPAAEAVLVAGDTTYRGAFALAATGGAVSGSGRVEWTNGESYVGTLVEGRKHGKGRFNWVGGQWYEGDWVDDRATGHGVIQFAGGNRYEGAWSLGKKHGQGRLTWAGGDGWEGEFRDDQQTDNGKSFDAPK